MALKCGSQAETDRSGVWKVQQEIWNLAEIEKMQRIQLDQRKDRKEAQSHRSLEEQVGNGILTGEIKG